MEIIASTGIGIRVNNLADILAESVGQSDVIFTGVQRCAEISGKVLNFHEMEKGFNTPGL